ncbi:MAG: hypothetical protein R2762_24765 [Bryobacteraceae bacterium]
MSDIDAALRAAPVLAATEYWIVPSPLPLAPEVTVTHAALLAAIHAHPAGAVTGMLPPVIAVELMLAEPGGGIEYVQAVDPAWLTSKCSAASVCSLKTICPVRGNPAFAATE